MTTLIAYPGSKVTLAPEIVARMAPHRVYVEPFCGSAAVLFNKSRVAYELVNDRDNRLVTLLRVVRDQPEALAAKLAMTPYARAEFQQADPGEPGIDDVEMARRVCVRIGQSFAKAGLTTPSKGWRMSTAVGRACASTWADMPDRVMAACDRLRGVHIDCLDALAVIERYGVDPTAVIYVDPPYLGTTRTTAFYAHEMPTEEQHRGLAAALDNCQAHVLLSGYHSPLYDELYGAWHREEFRALANTHSGRSMERVEVLWSNRPLEAQGTIFEGMVA